MTQQEPDLPLRLLARVFLPFACGYYFSYFFRTVNAMIWPDLVRDIGVDANRLGLLTSAYFLAFALFQLPLGVLLDRYGPRRVNAGLLVIAACGAVIFGTSQSLAGLVAGRALIGLGVSGCLMASLKAFTLWFPMSRFASLNGWLLAVGGLGALSASAPVELALKVTDWRHVFDLLAVLTFAASMLIFFVVPDRAEGPARASVRELVAGFGTIYSDAVFWRVAGVSLTAQAVFLATQGLWVAPWLRDVAGFDRPAVAGVLVAMAIATTIGFAASGTVSDWLVKRGVMPLVLFKWGAAVLMLLMLSFAAGLTATAVAAWCLFALVAPTSTLSYAILTRRYNRALTGRVNTAVNVLSFVGAFIAQWGIGAVVNEWTPEAGRYPPVAYAAAFGACVAAQALALVPLLTLKEVGPR
jgi:predicted MFS family arabinose efflux permease